MKVISMNVRKKELVNHARALFGEDRVTITRPELIVVRDELGIKSTPSWLRKLKTGTRGVYWLPTEDGKYGDAKANASSTSTGSTAVSAVAMAPSAIGVMDQQDSYVPERFNGYVPWGNYSTVQSVIKAGIFYPIFITGMSGNGKTLMVKEVCAKLKREYVRANITIETDEDDLIGGFRLINGETVWHDGPVVTAMKRGAVLLLDEIDLASNKIMALQPVLEGSSIYLKKIGKWIHPEPGFTVIATANTKGQGSDDGRFIGTNVLNEAFLERFPVTIEQSYPTAKMETKMLVNELAKHDLKDDSFVDNLIKWADVIRKTFMEGGCDEIISTRRLVHIIGAYSIFKDKMTAIQLTVNRFDTETKESFLDLYTKIDAGVDVTSINESSQDDDDDDGEELPF
jgi:hypothetical protein